jgi:hypothetical protein
MSEAADAFETVGAHSPELLPYEYFLKIFCVFMSLHLLL